MRVECQRLHLGEVHHRTIVGNERDGQGQQGVLHPEALNRRPLEDEQHSLVLGHFLAMHQARGALVDRLRDLGIDLMHAGGQCHTRQIGLRLLGADGGRRRCEHQRGEGR
jgi:hypothetical protein